MLSVNAYYSVNGNVWAVHSSTLGFHNVVGRKVSTLLKALLRDQPVDGPYETFAVLRRLLTCKCEWTPCDIDDMLSLHCDYWVNIGAQPAKAKTGPVFAEEPYDFASNDRFTDEDAFSYDSEDDSEYCESVISSDDFLFAENPCCYHPDSDYDGSSEILRSPVPDRPTLEERSRYCGPANRVLRPSKPLATFEAMPPITDTYDSPETDDRDLDVELSDDALSARPTDETYTVWRQSPLSNADHPEETDRLCRLEDTFDMLDELAAKTMWIVAGAARFWDGIPSASSSSPETAPSAEDSRCLLKYAQTLEKMEANYKAARSLVEGVINKHRPSA